MDESLKDLLEAEKQAESIVAQGERKRDEIIQQAVDDARALEQQFHDRVPEMHQSFSDKAQERAVQSIAEIKVRYDERNKEMRALAEQHAEDAVEHALKLILSSDSKDG
jgi:V/A-type H+/Na+-transporting ATPase subunit G/H